MLAYIHRELYIVDDLRTKMLIGNDILGPENMIIDVASKTAKIRSCNNAIAIITV